MSEPPQPKGRTGEESWAKVKEIMNVALTVEFEEPLQHPGGNI